MVRIDFSDGSSMGVSAYELDKIEELGDAIGVIERAKNLYEMLRNVFEKSSAP